MSDDVQEEEHCYQVALPATDAPMTVGRLTDLLLRERAAVRAELSHELEVERLRLAACGVAARGGDDECFADMKIEYNSDVLQATRKLRDERDALKVEQASYAATFAGRARKYEADIAQLSTECESHRMEREGRRERIEALQSDNDRLRAELGIRIDRIKELREAVAGSVVTLQACAYGWGDRDELRGLLRKLEAALAKLEPSAEGE